ncbi:MAG: single-stranded-DNA-specific exonuclease RecJ [Oscillospiraceae bacterium]|nr:single-stranded-DNA-specific exonuclease RecJ [Oscillospiraceae bacterium]
MKAREWKIEYEIPELPEELLRAGYNPLLAYVLAIRGITTAAEASSLIEENETLLHDPLLMKNMAKAAQRVRRAIASGEKTAVFGDYDVDGITSTCLLADYLSSKGIPCTAYIPDRSDEGYGLNCTAIKKLKEEGITLIITVDCGITALEETAYASSLGIDIIITDHHECKDGILPAACAVVDCKQPDDPYPFPDLAGVGVAFKLACACEGDTEEILNRYADLVAIGTVADVMPLIDENRFLVRRGIEMLRANPRPGLEAMLRESGMDAASISASSIGFSIAPRLNAAGRLGHALMGAELIRCKQPDEASTLASQLCNLNRERQNIENHIWQEANRLLQGTAISTPVVLASERWHQGVIGIAASRIAEQYSIPTVMITLNGDVGKGSCRSCVGFNLYDALSACSDTLISFGGHSQAAGLNIRKDRIDAFRTAFSAYYKSHLPEEQPEVTCELLIADSSLLSVENVRSLDLLEPYGNCNQKPVMCMLGVHIESASNVGGGKHLKLKLLSGSNSFTAIYFGHRQEEYGLRPGELIDVAFCPQINEFRGMTSVQLVVCGLRRHDPTALCRNILEQGSSYLRAASSYTPERNDFVRVWKALSSAASLGKNLHTLLDTCPKDMAPEQYCICLSVFREAGLLSSPEGGIYGAEPENISGKADLEATPLLRRLRALQS